MPSKQNRRSQRQRGTSTVTKLPAADSTRTTDSDVSAEPPVSTPSALASSFFQEDKTDWRAEESPPTSARLIYPSAKELEVPLGRMDQINHIREHNSNMSKFQGIANIAIGLAGGVIVNWVSGKEIEISDASKVFVGACIVIALIMGAFWVQEYLRLRRVYRDIENTRRQTIGTSRHF